MKIKQITINELPFPQFVGQDRFVKYKLPYLTDLLLPDGEGNDWIGGGATIGLLVFEEVNLVLFGGQIVGRLEK